MPARTDALSLVAGLALVGLATLLILDQSGAIELTPGWFGAALSAALGSILLTNGLRD